MGEPGHPIRRFRGRGPNPLFFSGDTAIRFDLYWGVVSEQDDQSLSLLVTMPGLADVHGSPDPVPGGLCLTAMSGFQS